MLRTRSWLSLSLVLSACALSACAHSNAQSAAASPTHSAPTIEPAPSSPTMGAEIGTQEFHYQVGDTQLKGFLAFPATAVDRRPGVLIAHEWWGLDDHTRAIARKLADAGYVALAIDMYGEGKSSEHPAEAGEWMAAVMKNPDEGTKRFEAGKAALLADAHVDPSRIAAIGYCMGGALVLQAVRRGDDFKAVGIFHGNYVTQTPLAKDKFKGKIFVAHGAADTMSTNEQAEKLNQELEAAGASYQIISYPGAKHGFTNPRATELGQQNKLDIGYDANADTQSWAKLIDVLAHAFN